MRACVCMFRGQTLIHNRHILIMVQVRLLSVVIVRCCYRHAGYVTAFAMHFRSPVWLRSARCSGYEEDITQCTYWCIRGQTNLGQCLLGNSGYCRSNRVTHVSCNTSMQRIIITTSFHIMLSLIHI